MSQGPARGIEQDAPFVLDGVEFVPAWVRPSHHNSFTVQKSSRTVARDRAQLAEMTRPTMVELGILQGGSVALLTLLANPGRFIAIEYSDQPIQALAAFIDERQLHEVVRPHYGVDQADRKRLEAIIRSDIGDEPLDLVIDDASHRYAETVISFEVLFGRLAPGGLYVVEDWTCHDAAASVVARALATPDFDGGDRLRAAFAANQAELETQVRPEPLSRLAIELVAARAISGDVVAEVQVDEDWLVVRRGPAPVDVSSFRLHDLVPDHFRMLRPLPDAVDQLVRPPAGAGHEKPWWEVNTVEDSEP
jgi:predicted O-methyltransferase YrrM